MELFGIDISPVDFQKVKIHLNMRYPSGEFNYLPEEYKRAEIVDIILFC